MTLATSESRVMGLKKEAVRGTAEAAPDRWRAIMVDTELEYTLALIEDEARRGISARFPKAPGVKAGTGAIKFPVRASEIGEFVHMATGAPVSTLVSTALAYQHVFTVPQSSIQPPSYTLWLNRGVVSKRYSLGNISELTFSGDQEGLAQMEASVMFKSEDTDSTDTPSFANESEEFTSYQASLKIDGVANVQVKSYSFKLENGLFPQRTLSLSQDIKDLLAVGPFKVSGSFDIYLEDMTQRDKFLAATQSSLELLIEGDIIEDAAKFTLKILCPKIKYTAFPFGDMDGLLGASVEFEAEYDLATSKLADFTVINKVVSY